MWVHNVRINFVGFDNYHMYHTATKSYQFYCPPKNSEGKHDSSFSVGIHISERYSFVCNIAEKDLEKIF